ncbi:hypothetical protein H6770_04510 [Candidatus Peribacteria bacterium]|nr:hypothetical protein [Candidatus Peribacteria bacterium]
MTNLLNHEAPLSEKLIKWEEIDQFADELKSVINEATGRIALLIHTGGGCLGTFQNGQYHPVLKGADKYLLNIRSAIQEESSVIVFLGAFFKTIADVRTRAIGIDLPSAPDIPIPDLGQELKWGDFTSWEPVREKLTELGVNTISPFGGETTRLDENTRVTGGCVNGALRQVKDHFITVVHPQLCGDESGNCHIQTEESLSINSYLG